MNYCRKCQSDYEKPGTCNCFAPQAATVFVPWIQTPPLTWPQTTISYTCAVCGKVNCGETHVTVYWSESAAPSAIRLLEDSANEWTREVETLYPMMSRAVTS